MFNILFARTFFIVGGMLLLTAATARINKTFETKKEAWGTIIVTFVLLFAVMFFSDSFPLNLLLVAAFSALIGWQIGPGIENYGKKFKLRKYLKENSIVVKKGEKMSVEQVANFEKSLESGMYNDRWNVIISQALISTAFAVFATSSIVYLTKFDFSILQGFLFIALLILIIMGVLNALVFHSRLFSLVKAYFGVAIFTLYLLFDFNQLEKMAGDETWGTAVTIAVSLYLDIINLFLYLLEILGSSD